MPEPTNQQILGAITKARDEARERFAQASAMVLRFDERLTHLEGGRR